MKRVAAIITVGILAACQPMASETTTSSSDPLYNALAGKTATNVETGGVLMFMPNGRLTGAVEGAWTIRDGQFCRTLTAPEQLAGTLCQGVTIEGDTATFVGGAAGDSVWTLS